MTIIRHYAESETRAEAIVGSGYEPPLSNG